MGDFQTMTPKEIVAKLDEFIVGQNKAKRAVAIALRNRVRRLKLPDDIRDEIAPKNILMMGPTGVGKTEIARRLAKLCGAPFLKVEATKYTEVGYVGRDVESMIRDLMATGYSMVKAEMQTGLKAEAERRAEEVLLDLLLPGSRKNEESQGLSLGSIFGKLPFGQQAKGSESAQPGPKPDTDNLANPSTGITILDQLGAQLNALSGTMPNAQQGSTAGAQPAGAQPAGTQGNPQGETQKNADSDTRERFRQMLREGRLDERKVEVNVAAQGMPAVEIFSGSNYEEMEMNFQGLSSLFGGKKKKKLVSVKEARSILVAEELDKLVDHERVVEEARNRVQEMGIIFIDEMDKIANAQSKAGGVDVSREGVQRDILPIVEGSTVTTKYGAIDTTHILFIAAGAFNVSKPSDLIPELQGRFPIRVELEALTAKDFERILTEPKNALTRQYVELLGTEGVKVEFMPDAIARLSEIATEINSKTENIGARRLHTILERLLEELSFDACELSGTLVSITVDFVNKRFSDVIENQDLSRYIL